MIKIVPVYTVSSLRVIRHFIFRDSSPPIWTWMNTTTWVIFVRMHESIQYSPEILTFFNIILKMKSLSNLIFKTKYNGIMFDMDFISKTMLKKSEHLRGNCIKKKFWWIFCLRRCKVYMVDGPNIHININNEFIFMGLEYDSFIIRISFVVIKFRCHITSLSIV